MQNFDASFLALRPEPEALQTVAKDFKIYFKQVPGPTPPPTPWTIRRVNTSTTPKVRPRLFSTYGTAPAVIAADIKTLMGERSS